MQDRTCLIDAAKLHSILNDRDVRVLDCRFELMDPKAGRKAYESGHVPGAVYADLDKDLAGPVKPGTGRHPLPDPRHMAQTFGRLGIDNRCRVVAYDEGSGAVAARAWWLLRWLGHESVSILDGGFSGWAEAGLPIESDPVEIVPKSFTGQSHDERVLTTDDILAAGETASGLRLIDARDVRRFVGEVEPIDKVAGHIPGALNLPFSKNLAANGCWKSADELRDSLAELIGPPSGQRWAVMCGSGVTACHLVIAGILAGYREPRVYVGSWSEWIADPARKIAKGVD